MGDSKKSSQDSHSLRQLVNAALMKWWQPIPKILETEFQKYQYRHNIRFYALIGCIGYFAFFAYAAADRFVTPDIADVSLLTRSIFTVIALPTSHWLLSRFKNAFYIELHGALLTTLAALIWFRLLSQSQSQHIPIYLYASVTHVVLLNIGVRNNFFKVALPVSLLLSAVVLYYVFVLTGNDAIDAVVFGLVYIPTLVFSLFISWQSAQLSRRLFLYSAINKLNKDDLEEANQNLLRQSHTDFLTKLPNRLLFNDSIQRAIARARRDQSKLALMFVDLDKFKQVNDTYGHAIGDLLLQEVACRMVDCVRESDVVARIGGDEFLVLLPAIDEPGDAVLVAEKIRKSIDEPFNLNDVHLNISSSIGIAIFPDHGSDAESLNKNADAALYRVKAAGRNKIEMGTDLSE
jgi:diguanylate cyclase (GGDEF)-like protein